MTDKFFELIGYRNRFSKWFKPMSLERLIKEANRLLAKAEKLTKQDNARIQIRDSRRLACQSRSKLITKNATIRKEFVKCKKPNCHQRQHGPYYYAYWKDHETNRLKKRYIGSHYYPNIDEKK
jgi:phage anti-repressor protein